MTSQPRYRAVEYGGVEVVATLLLVGLALQAPLHRYVNVSWIWLTAAMVAAICCSRYLWLLRAGFPVARPRAWMAAVRRGQVRELALAVLAAGFVGLLALNPLTPAWAAAAGAAAAVSVLAHAGGQASAFKARADQRREQKVRGLALDADGLNGTAFVSSSARPGGPAPLLAALSKAHSDVRADAGHMHGSSV